MGLIGNKTLLHKLPLVQTGGTFASDIGVIDNWHCKENANLLTSVPSGYYKGWVLPQFAGKISSYKNLKGSVNLNVIGFNGLNINSDITGSSDVTIIATLITSILGNISSTGSVNPTIQGLLNASANLDGDSSLYTSMSALANILSNVLNNSSLNSDNTSLGSISSDITSFSTLSPENIAIAVWNKLVTGSYSAQQCMDILTAVAAGKTTINSSVPGEAVVVFRNLDDTEDKVEAHVIASERVSIIT